MHIKNKGRFLFSLFLVAFFGQTFCQSNELLISSGQGNSGLNPRDTYYSFENETERNGNSYTIGIDYMKSLKKWKTGKISSHGYLSIGLEYLNLKDIDKSLESIMIPVGLDVGLGDRRIKPFIGIGVHGSFLVNNSGFEAVNSFNEHRKAVQLRYYSKIGAIYKFEEKFGFGFYLVNQADITGIYDYYSLVFNSFEGSKESTIIGTQNLFEVCFQMSIRSKQSSVENE